MKHEEVVQMSLFTKIKKLYAQATPKQFIMTGVFMLSLAGAIAGGFATKQYSSAAVYTGRDPDRANSIMNSGSIGCLSKQECVDDIKANQPSDLQGIYNKFGLQSNEYDRFLKEAKEGVVYRNGTVVVDGQVVMNNTWSIGRKPKGYSWQYPISGVGTYHASKSQDVQGSDLPVYVLFDDNGTVEFVVMKACGNAVGGDKVESGAKCNALKSHPVTNKKNTYTFTADAKKWGLAQFAEFRYYTNDGSGWKWFDTQSAGDKHTQQITFTKATKVKVEVTIYLPGGKSKIIKSTLCEKEIGVVKEEFLYKCEALIRTFRENDNRKVRFTAIHKKSNNVTLDSADFTLDGTLTSKNVKTKDDEGHIYKDYDFSGDNKAHKVSVVINFTADGKKVTSAQRCEARTDKVPECKPGIPVGDERCKDYCKPGIEVGSKECEDLPKTGAGGVAGLFAGVSAAGAFGHRLYMRFRARK